MDTLYDLRQAVAEKLKLPPDFIYTMPGTKLTESLKSLNVHANSTIDCHIMPRMSAPLRGPDCPADMIGDRRAPTMTAIGARMLPEILKALKKNNVEKVRFHLRTFLIEGTTPTEVCSCENGQILF